MEDTIFIKDKTVCVKPLQSRLKAIQKLKLSITGKRCRSFASVPRLHELQPLTDEEIENKICSMNNKTCKLDAIPTYLIKDILLAVLKTITQIVNMSLTTGTFPLHWKTAIIR